MEYRGSTEFMANGNCREHPPEVFFPSDGAGVVTAQNICNTCPVKDDCLEYALGNHIDHGIWGGTSERQRRRLLKAMRKASKDAA